MKNDFIYLFIFYVQLMEIWKKIKYYSNSLQIYAIFKYLIFIYKKENIK